MSYILREMLIFVFFYKNNAIKFVHISGNEKIPDNTSELSGIGTISFCA